MSNIPPEEREHEDDGESYVEGEGQPEAEDIPGVPEEDKSLEGE